MSQPTTQPPTRLGFTVVPIAILGVALAAVGCQGPPSVSGPRDALSPQPLPPPSQPTLGGEVSRLPSGLTQSPPTPDPPSAVGVSRTAPFVAPPRPERLRLPGQALTAWPPPPAATIEPASRREVVRALLEAHGLTPSEKVPPAHRLDWAAPVQVLVRQPQLAGQAWRLALLQNDAEAAFALISTPTREAIQARLAQWQRLAQTGGKPALIAYLGGHGHDHHARALADIEDLATYGLRRYFDTAWANLRANPNAVWEALNSWEVSTPGSPAAVRLTVGRFTAVVAATPLAITVETGGLCKVDWPVNEH